MTIVLNENEWAQDMIAARSLGKKPYETLCRVARYYLDEGYSRKDTRVILETFLTQCRNDASTTLWMDTLDRAVSYAAKHPAVQIGSITVTKPEIDRIRSTAGTQTQRLAFTLLCLSKYCSAVNPDANGWVWIDDRDIMKMANIKTSVKRQSILYRQLRDDGMLQFSKKVDNTNVCVLFAEDGEETMRITDMRNLGNQFMMHEDNAGYFVCKGCGVVDHRVQRRNEGTIQKSGPKIKYCSECAKAMGTRATAKAVKSASAG